MVEWLVSEAPVGYPEAVAAMEAHVAAMQAGNAGDRVWLLEHPPLYTAGTSARETDLLQPGRFPVYRTGRGGQYTYHGPGQRVAYAMLDLRPRGSDLRRYVHDLEEWIIRALARFNVRGERRPGRIGIWVSRPWSHGPSAFELPSPLGGEGAGGEGFGARERADESIAAMASSERAEASFGGNQLSSTTSGLGTLTREAPPPLPPGSSPGQALSPGGERESFGFREDKIAAIGVRVRRWIAFHGIAVNLDPDLSHFQGIVPCGIAPGPDSRFGVTSLHDLGILAAMPELDIALKGAFAEVFEATGGERTQSAAQ